MPTRFDAQADAVNLIYNAKTGANPESSVGLMSMGGSGPEVLTTLTTDMGKILDGVHRTKIKGASHFTTGVNIAALALKHRQNKSQRQRIIVFACSEVHETEKELVKLAKKMKKNNISIDVVAFGELSDDNLKKLQAFNENIKGGDGSHLEVVQPGPNLLSDSILASPILAGEGGMGGSGGGGADGGAGGSGGQGEYEFGVNPELDPELALALRMSYEEEKARQEKEKKAKEDAEGKEKLEGIPEGDEEKQPLLDQNGEASGSKDKKDKDGDDKMDTA